VTPTEHLYELSVDLQRLDDGGDYQFMATSEDLPGLVVAGDTPEEVLSLVPQVASALIASIKAAGDPLPSSLRASSSLPLKVRVTVAA
jgi:predicted RNase H-like HicB family nuclease